MVKRITGSIIRFHICIACWFGLMSISALALLGADPVQTSRSAGSYTVRRWTTDDGLPDSQICGVVSGREGYLWLVTARFLVRFDGLRFTPIPVPLSTTGGRNEGVYQDRRGGLWVYGYAGVARYIEGEGWMRGEQFGMPKGRVIAVAGGADGRLYFAQEHALVEWQEGRIRSVLDGAAFPLETATFRQLVCDGEGSLWIAYGEGLYRWAPGRDAAPRRMTEARAVWQLLAVGTRGMVAHGGSLCLHWDGQQWHRSTEVRAITARCLLHAPDGRLWMGHDAGIDEHVEQESSRRLLYGPFRVLALTLDREENIWAATTEGLMRLRRRVLQGIPMKGNPGAAEVSVIWVEPDGRVWAGLRAGGVATGDAEGLEPLLVPPEFTGVALNALYREVNGTLWCGGLGGSLWTLQNQSLQRIAGAEADDVQAILGSGGLPAWIATRRGILTFNGDKNRLVEMTWPLDAVLALWQDPDGTLWMGHESQGLSVLYPNGKGEVIPEAKLPGRTVRAIYRDRRGVLWVGGLNGLTRLEKGTYFTFRTAHGLWNDSIRQITEDADGYVWLATAGGIMRIAQRELAEVASGNKTLLDVRTFGEESGMEQLSCTGGVFSPAEGALRNRLWFPTRGGLLSVDARMLPPLRPAPDLHVVAVAGGRLVQMRKGDRAAWSVEADNPRDVRVEYAALDFATPERVRFRYELEGPYRVRSALTQERSMLFSRLPTGDYTFRVTACNGDGVWNPQGVEVTWSVNPFFWETMAFRLWCLLLCGGAIAVTVRAVERQRVRRRLQVVEREQELARERARIARDLHDEIGAKLTRLSLLGSMAAEDARGVEPLCREVEEMADTARETHRAFDEIVWSVSPRNDTVRSLSHYICKYAEEFFAGTPVVSYCELPDDLSDRPIEPQSRHQMFLAVKESLHNVLKHGQATRVDLVIEQRKGVLRVDVRDNGKGFDPVAAQAQGDGLRNMQERMKAVGGTLTIESCAGAGSHVVFSIPVGEGDHGEEQ